MPRENRERRYIAEYLLETYPQGGYYTNVALGPIPDEITARYGLSAGAALFQPSRLRIDAVVPQKTSYLLIEAKIREPRDAIGNLLLYRTQAQITPDLPEYVGQPFQARLVVPWALDWVVAAAKEHGMEIAIYLPPWVEGYVRERQNYFTRDYRIARDEKMRLRKLLGVD